MSFFGFDATLPRDRGHPATGPGFKQAQDPFAGLSKGPAREEEDDDAYVLNSVRYLTMTDMWQIQYRFR